MAQFEKLDKTVFYYPDAHSIAMATDGKERFRIDSRGQFGFGTKGNLDPKERLRIQGETNNATTLALNVTDSNKQSLLAVRNDGSVGIGIPAPVTTNASNPNENASIGAKAEAKERLRVQGETSDATKFAVNVTNANKTSLFAVRNDGHVGIGTKTSGRPLTIRAEGAVEELIGFEDPAGNVKWHLNQKPGGNNPGLNIVQTAGTQSRLFIRASDGNVGLSHLNPNHRLVVNGTVAKTTAGVFWTIISDERLKKNIQTLQGALDKIVKLRGVSYEWIKSEEHGDQVGPQMGMIAQEVEQVFPEWVNTDPAGFKELTLNGFEALVVEAIKTLQQKNVALQTENENLRAQINNLEIRVVTLERRRGRAQTTQRKNESISKKAKGKN